MPTLAELKARANKVKNNMSGASKDPVQSTSTSPSSTLPSISPSKTDKTDESFEYVPSHHSREASEEKENQGLKLAFDFNAEKEKEESPIPTPIPIPTHVKITAFQSETQKSASPHPYYSIHDPLRSTSTGERKVIGVKKKTLDSTSFNPEEVLKDDEGWYDKRKSTSSSPSKPSPTPSKGSTSKSSEQEQVMKLELELSKLRKEKEDLMLDISRRGKKEEELRQRNNQKKEELIKYKDMDKNFEDVKERLRGATQEIVSLEIGKQNYEKEMENKEKKLQSLEGEIETIRTQLAELKMKYKTIKDDYKIQKGHLESRTEELIITKDEFSKGLTKIQSLERSLADSVKEKIEMETTIKDLKEKIGTVLKDKKFLEQEVIILSTKIDSITHKHQILTDDLNARVSKLSFDLSGITAQKETISAHSSSLRVQIVNLAETKLKLEREMEENARVHSLEKVAWKVENEKTQKLELFIRELEDELSESKTVIGELLEALDKMEKEKEELQLEIKGEKAAFPDRTLSSSELVEVEPSLSSITPVIAQESSTPLTSVSIDVIPTTPTIPVSIVADIPTFVKKEEVVGEVDPFTLPLPASVASSEASYPSIKESQIEEPQQVEEPREESQVEEPQAVVLGSNATPKLTRRTASVVSSSSTGSSRDKAIALEVDEVLRLAEASLGED